jgi:lysophospholipase L1-like esterase
MRSFIVAPRRSSPRSWWTASCLAATLVACGQSSVVRDTNADGRIVVACLGDSNTDSRWPPPQTRKWCELAAAETPGWIFRNHAVSGATVTHWPAAPSWVGPQLDEALAADAPDAVVLAFGTNDVRAGQPTDRIVAAYRDAATAVMKTGALVFVALTPPIHPPEPEHAEAIAALNTALRAAFPATRLVDFAADMRDTDYEADGLHPNSGGQRKRAAAALRALGAPTS